jgi:predicted O-linked N-acetylglucosamine transferase (SPINDLY family)
VGASLLTALNLSELITYSLMQYEGQAVRLATDPDYFLAIKNKLELNRCHESLFNSQLFAKNIESIYQDLLKKA